MRAFTLLETMIAMAISSVIAAAATTATVGIYRTLLAKEQQGSADEEARALLEQLGSGVFQIGGGDVRPWSAVSNGCYTGTAGCDRGGKMLRYVDINEDLPQVRILTASTTAVTVDLVAGVCPLTAWPASLDIVLLPIAATGGGWRAARCTTNTSGSSCACQLTDLALAPAHGGVPAAPSPSELPANATSFPTTHFVAGVMAPAQVVTITHNETTRQLLESRDFKNDGTYASRLLSDSVWAFRVQFGFDAIPEDGVLDQLAVSVGDRRNWVTALEQATSPPACAVAPAACATPATSLRIVRFGLIVGARSPARSTPSQAVLFPETTTGSLTMSEPRGVLLRATSTVITMRSLLVFN